VSLDLPGYGGSDSPTHYGTNEVLNVIVEAIVELKRLHLRSESEQSGHCILIGHDWGGAIAYRIAAETKSLVDRVVILNSIHVSISYQQL